MDTEYKNYLWILNIFPKSSRTITGKPYKNHNLDDILDGLLIKSENWQALNTILTKYKKSATIYIDPPFNTGSDFAYLDKYQNSMKHINGKSIDIARILLNYKVLYVYI